MFCNSFTHRHATFLYSQCAMSNKICANNLAYNKKIIIIIMRSIILRRDSVGTLSTSIRI